MSKHTPGPWMVLTNRTGYPYQIQAINGDDKKPGAVGSCITRWASISLPSSEEGKANARLIASAPDLLDALLYYRDNCTGAEPSLSVFHRMLDGAIAKAAHGEPT